MRALVITYGFPPVAGMSPLRSAYLVRALVDRGHDVTVLTAERPPEYSCDDATLDLAPTSAKIIRIAPGPIARFVRTKRRPVTEGERGEKNSGDAGSKLMPLARAGMASMYHALLQPFMIPDATVEWYWNARRRLKSVLAGSEFDVVYSFAYPFSCHYLGGFAAHAGSAPWVMDYGDPWSIDALWDVPKWRKAVDRRRERRFLMSSAYHVVTTQATKNAYVRAFPEICPETWVVATCGYSPGVYGATAAALRVPGKFRIVYTGVYGRANRCEIDLIRSLQQVDGDDWQLVLAGVNLTGKDDALRKYCHDAGLEHRVDIRGQVPHSQAVSLQLSADLLVAWGWPGGMQIPGKIFEYIGARRPILLISGDEHDAAGCLIRRLRRGIVVSNDHPDLTYALGDALASFRDGGWTDRFDLAVNEENSWQNQVAIIADLCEEAAAR